MKKMMLMMLALTLTAGPVVQAEMEMSKEPATAPAKQKAKGKKKAAKKVEMYHCPMHTDVVSDKPGRCTTCGMDLEKMPAAPPSK